MTRTTIRHFMIRQGLIKPNGIKETREVFPFPADIQEQPKLPLRLYFHIEKMGSGYTTNSITR